jgi:hypothetical protein
MGGGGGGAVGVAGVIEACHCQHSPWRRLFVSNLWSRRHVPKTLHGRHSLRRLGQKAYQILAAHGRLRRGGGTRSAGCHSLCSGEKRGEEVCQLDGVGLGGGVERQVQRNGRWAPMGPVSGQWVRACFRGGQPAQRGGSGFVGKQESQDLCSALGDAVWLVRWLCGVAGAPVACRDSEFFV